MSKSDELASCYACQVNLAPENESFEHILPNGIGGRLRSLRLLCKKCNNTFGTKYEAKFIEDFFFIIKTRVKLISNDEN